MKTLRNNSIKSNNSQPPDPEDDPSKSRADFETAIDAAGYGQFHYFLLLVCGFAFGCFPTEVLSISFLLPAAECDLKLTSENKGWMSAITFVGMMVGSYIWGSLGDSLGRKKIIIIALTIDGIFTIFSSLSQSFGSFIALRFFAGIGLSGVLVIFPYFAEFQPRARRGGMVSLLDAFYIEGNLLMTCLAWLIIPQTWQWGTESFQYDSWRFFTAVCGGLSLLAANLLTLVPESPKYLLTKNRHAEALTTFRTIYARNTHQDPLSYPYTQFVIESTDPENGNTEAPSKVQPKLSWFSRLKVTLCNVKEQSITLFSAQLIRNTVIMIFLQFILQFANSGLLLWLPELFDHLEKFYDFEENVNVTSATVCHAFNFRPANDSNSSGSLEIDCNPANRTSDQIFINALVIAVTPLPGNVWTYIHTDKLGRKFFIVLGMGAAGLCAGLVLVMRSPTDTLIVAAFFNFFGNLAFNAINVLSTELFPTAVRSSAIALTFVSARVGSILGTVLFGALIDVICFLPIALFGLTLAGGGLIALFLPNTSKMALT